MGWWYELLPKVRGGTWRGGGEEGSGDAGASWGEGAWMISGVASPLTGTPVLVVIWTGKDGALGDSERGTYLSKGERERVSLRVGGVDI